MKSVLFVYLNNKFVFHSFISINSYFGKFLLIAAVYVLVEINKKTKTKDNDDHNKLLTNDALTPEVNW